MPYLMKQRIIVILGLFLLASCAGSQSNPDTPASQEGCSMQGDTIVVAPNSPLAQKLECRSLQSQPYDMVLTSTGVVQALPACYAEVSVPFAGRVQRSLVRIGQQVKAGTPLFEIYSSEYSEVVKNLLQAKSALSTAQKSAARVRDLHANHVASDKELEEAEAMLAMVQEDYRHAVAVAQEFQVDTRNAEVGKPMVVRSPIAGRVLCNELVMGEYLKEDAPAKVVVADLATVWVKANIAENEAPLVEDVGEVTVQPVSRPDERLVGKVTFTGGMLDPDTRTLQTLVEVKNSEGHLLPNMYANLEMRVRKKSCMLVPKEAVLQGEEGRYVLRKVGENRFVRTLVQVQTVDDENLIVTDGLAPDDEVVTSGAFYLIDCK